MIQAYRSIPAGARPNAEDVEALLLLRDAAPSEIVKILCNADIEQARFISVNIFIFPGFGRSVLRYPEEMKAALRQRAVKGLLHVLSLFTIHKIPPTPSCTNWSRTLFHLPASA